MRKCKTLRKTLSMLLAMAICISMLGGMTVVLAADVPTGGTATPYIYVDADGFNYDLTTKTDSTWTNKGSGSNLTVLNSSNTYMVATENTFNNGTKSLKLTAIRMGENISGGKTTPHTLIMMVKNDGAWTNSAASGMFFNGTSGTNGFTIWGEKDGSYKVACGKNVNDKKNVGYKTTKGWRVIAGSVDTTNGLIAYENGNKVGTLAYANSIDKVTQWGIGSNNNSDRWAEFATVLIYEEALSATEIKSISDALLTKYVGVTATSAVADEHGEKITLTLSATPEADLAASDFTLNVGSGTQTIDKIEAGTNAGEVVISLPSGETLPYREIVTLTSNTGIVTTTTINVDVSAIENPNTAAPVLESANICVRGKEIVLKTDVQCELKSEADLTTMIVENGEDTAATVTAVSFKDKFAYLTLDTALPYNTAGLTLNDTGSNIVSTAGSVALPLSGQALTWYTDSVIPQDGLDLWLESDSGVTADSETGVLSSWADKTGNYTFSDGDIGTYTKTSIGGVNLPVVSSNNKDLSITRAYTGDWTWIVLTTPQKDIDGNIVDTGGTSAIGTLGGAIMWRANKSENINLQPKSGSEDTVLLGTQKEGLPLRMITFSYENASKTYNIYSDNEAMVTRTVTTGGDIEKYQLGSTRSKENYAAFMVYHRKLSEAEIQSVYQYLYEKYLYNEDNAYAVSSAYTVDAGGETADVTSYVKRRSVKGEPSATFIVGSYDGNYLTDVKMFNELHLPLWVNNNVTHDDVKIGTTPDLRVFTWNNLTNLAPLTEMVNSHVSE